MATDATGPVSPLGIPTIDPDADAPSGLGDNAIVSAIDTLIAARTKKPVTAGVKVWDTVTATWIDPSGAPTGSKFLRDDGSWQSVSVSTELAYTEFTAAVGGITGTNIAGAASVVTSGSVTYDGSTAVMIEFFCPYTSVTTANFRVIFELFEDATDIGEIGKSTPGSAAVFNGVHLERRRTPTNAAHTYTVKAFVPDGGTGVVGAGAGGAATAVPGFIRVRRA